MQNIHTAPWEYHHSYRSDAEKVAQPGGSLMTDQLALISQHGGWDYRLAPWDAWRMIIQDCPYPDDPQNLAQHPTFGPLDAILKDRSVTDIHANGPDHEIVKRRSGDPIELGTGQTWHPAWYDWLVEQFRLRGHGLHTAVQLQGTADATHPGQPLCLLRYEIACPPLCPHGPSLTIRVLRPSEWSLEQLVQLESLSHEVARFLAQCMRAGINLLIAGLRGTGKTTLAQALLDVIADKRIVCIEDVHEIVVRSKRSVSLERAAVGTISYADLVRHALRMNPDYIVAGECLGEESYGLIAAARNGYPILTTIHADNAEHALHNLITMALEATETKSSVSVVNATIKARPMIIVALIRRPDGKRQVAEVIEVLQEPGTATPRTEQLYERTVDDALVQNTPPSHALFNLLAVAGTMPKEIDR